MPRSAVYNLRSVAAEHLNPKHKMLPNGILSCTLNSHIVLEYINDPLIVPRSLRAAGDFNECEHTREPDHRLASSLWHAYIPVGDPSPSADAKAWVFQDHIPQFELFVPTFGRRGRVAPTFLKKVETVVGDILRWLPTVYAICGPPPVIISLQLSDLQYLESFCGAYNEVATELWRVRRSVLIALGYIIYSLSIKQDWQEHAIVTEEFTRNIISSGLLDLPRRGVIINAQDPPPFSEVIAYLQHKVPVYYYWKPGSIYWLRPATTHSATLVPEPAVSLDDEEIDGQEVLACSKALESASPPVPSFPLSTTALESPSPHVPSFPFKFIPTSDFIDHFKGLIPIDNDKTRWIVQCFNKPHVSFNSSFCVPRVPLPSHLQFITRGELAISKRTEARLRLWRTQYPETPLWFFSYHCLSRGLDWRVFTRLSDICDPSLATPIPKPSYLQENPRPLKKGPLLLADYVRRVQILLQQPHARRFLTMGGILWRIALHYGPSGFFSSAISVPSADASLHLHFDQGADPTVVDDRLSDAEISLLLGITENGSIWPTLEIWEKNEHWSGEWNAKAERWFQAHIREISTGSHFAIRTRKQWKATVRRHTAAALNNPRTVGTEAHAAWVCLQLDRLFPPSESLMSL